jgi:hypothetical protein
MRRRGIAISAVAAGLFAFAVGSFMLVRAFTNDAGWVAPMVLTANDPRVVQVEATLQQEYARRDELTLRKQDLEARLQQAERWQKLEESFQASFRVALKADLVKQRAELRRLQAMLAESASTANAVANSGSTGSTPTAVANSGSTPEAAARVAERLGDTGSAVPSARALEERIDAVRQRVRILEAASRDGAVPGSYSGLALRREYDRSLAATEEARASAETAGKALKDVEASLQQKAAFIASIESSPYHLAAKGDASLAFIPYDNAVKAGDSVVACKVGSSLCHPVGTLGERLLGEVRATSPRGGGEVRGQLAPLKLTEPESAMLPVLYAKAAR